MKHLFRNHPIAVSGFIVAAAVTLFFLFRIVASALYWSDPAHQNETVKAWMTVGYIAKSWGLNPREIDVLAGLPTPEEHGPWTIREIAAARGVEVQVVIDQVNASIAALRAKEPPRD
jgi:hypothetical protein